MLDEQLEKMDSYYCSLEITVKLIIRPQEF